MIKHPLGLICQMELAMQWLYLFLSLISSRQLMFKPQSVASVIQDYLPVLDGSSDDSWLPRTAWCQSIQLHEHSRKSTYVSSSSGSASSLKSTGDAIQCKCAIINQVDGQIYLLGCQYTNLFARNLHQREDKKHFESSIRASWNTRSRPQSKQSIYTGRAHTNKLEEEIDLLARWNLLQVKVFEFM